MVGALLSTFICCWLAAESLHVGTAEPPVSRQRPEELQRLDELAAFQDAALYGDGIHAAALYEHPVLKAPPHRAHNLRTVWGCDEKPFRMAMPAHSATCSVTQALMLTLKEAGIECTRNGKPLRNAGQDHDHHGLAQEYIDQGLWDRFNSTISFVMAKDPWSRVASAAAWMHGYNTSSPRDEQIRDFRNFVREHLPTYGPHSFGYLYSVSEFAFAVPPGKTEEEQVVTYVGRVKDLSASFRHVCSLLGVEPQHCVDPNDSRVKQHWVTHGSNAEEGQAWEKEGTRPSTVELYDEDTYLRVAWVWREDIARFGFKFGEL